MNRNSFEEQAADAVLGPLGDLVVNIGMQKGLGDYTKEEITQLVETVITTYQTELQRLISEDIPF